MADTTSRRGKSKKFTNRFVATAAPGYGGAILPIGPFWQSLSLWF